MLFRSPEVFVGAAASPASDIYSLGLVLYEVLTGQRAQVADTTSPLALSRSVCEQDPAPPSARLEAAGDRVTARRLRGDLDTIVMTALHKDATRRYASAAALSDDIERYLQGLPVEARAGSVWYRLGKTLARHRAATVAGVLVALAVAGGVAANETILASLNELARTEGYTFHAPPLALCGDNAAMIAWTGAEHFARGLSDGLDAPVRPRWPLDKDAAPALGAGAKGAKA